MFSMFKLPWYIGFMADALRGCMLIPGFARRQTDMYTGLCRVKYGLINKVNQDENPAPAQGTYGVHM